MHIKLIFRFLVSSILLTSFNAQAGDMLDGLDLTTPAMTEAEVTREELEDRLDTATPNQPADLTSMRLSGLDLSGIDFKGAVMRDARLNNANLNRVDFGFASLRNTNLSGADLTFANLGGADLTGAKINGANFDQADLHSAMLHSLTGDEASNLEQASYPWVSVPVSAPF
jgi:uncharacterized protein YjbI with pentapeptide repeats